MSSIQNNLAASTPTYGLYEASQKISFAHDCRSRGLNHTLFLFLCGLNTVNMLFDPVADIFYCSDWYW
jgi:hypothetical protein